MQSGALVLRWFTPSCEVELCGHATLAASLALHHWQQLPIGIAQRLQTRSGPLRVELQSSTSAAIDLPSGGLKPRSKEPWMQPFQPLQQWTSIWVMAFCCWVVALTCSSSIPMIPAGRTPAKRLGW